MAEIEQSSASTRCIDLRARMAASQKFWGSPEGRRRKAELDRKKRNRRNLGVKFPDLAKHRGTRPEVDPEVADWKSRLGI